MRSVAIHSTGQIFMVFYSTISQNSHKMGKISNIHTFEILGHPTTPSTASLAGNRDLPWKSHGVLENQYPIGFP